MKEKIDFNELKLKFFTSEEAEIKPFIEKNVGKRNGNFIKKTKGRAKEKQEYKLAILNNALEDNKEEMEERLKVRLKKMDEIYIKLTLKLEKKLDEDLSITELYNLWKIIRTEKGLTTNITKDPKIEAEIEAIKIEVVNYKHLENAIDEADLIQD